MTAGARMQRAIVRPLGSAHLHNTDETSPVAGVLPAHLSLKSLAGAVLDRTLQRTLSEQSAQNPCTVAPQLAGGPSERGQTELAVLVRRCAEAYSFTEREYAEALTAARANPLEALTCFRAIVRDLFRGSR